MKRRLNERAPETDAELFVYQVRVLSQLDLENEWAGWKLRGAWLVSPAGDRINAKRLAGMLFQEGNRTRLAKLRKRVEAVEPVPLSPARRVQGGALR